LRHSRAACRCVAGSSRACLAAHCRTGNADEALLRNARSGGDIDRDRLHIDE